MPRLSYIMVRTALLHLALGAAFGGLLLAEKGLQAFPWVGALRPGHIQIMLIGWVLQLAFGVAVWILPRRDAAGSRGNMAVVWVAYSALNGGVALAALHTPLAVLGDPAWFAWMQPLAGLCYLVAMAAIAIHVWRRIVPFGPLPPVEPRPKSR